MSITFVGASTIGSVAADPPSFSLTLPTLAANDIIIIKVMSKNIVIPANEINTPTGYAEIGVKTTVDSATAADDMRTALFFKRAVIGDSGASVTISRAGTDILGLYAIAHVWRGATLVGSPFDTAGIVIGGSATAGDVIVFPAIDPVQPNVHVIYDGWKADDITDALANFVNDNTTFVIRNDQETTTGTDASSGIWSADRTGAPLSAVSVNVVGTDGSYIGYSYALLANPNPRAPTYAPLAKPKHPIVFNPANLLATLLAVTAADPFQPISWPNPRGPVPAIELRTWTQSVNPEFAFLQPKSQHDWPVPKGPSGLHRGWIDQTKINLIGQDRLPKNQFDWPVPKGAARAIDLRTWTQSLYPEIFFLYPHSQYDWPNPRGYVPAISLRTWIQQYYHVTITPHVQHDWPNPRGYIPAIDLRTHIQSLYPEVVFLFPKNQYDWPNPRGYRRSIDLWTWADSYIVIIPEVEFLVESATAADTYRVRVVRSDSTQHLIRDLWDRDEWGRFIPGAGYRKVP